MNFKFLFKNNINDNRLMEQAQNPETSTIKFNGIDTGYVYDNELSARQNRKLLKLTLKAKGIGDKADATGLISEYLTTNGGAKGKDAAWLAKKSNLYGYTTDANGNRDYHRTGNPAGRTFATILGGLVMGPTGAFIGNQLAKRNNPEGLVRGFYSPPKSVKTPGEVPVDEVPVDEVPVDEAPVDEVPVPTTPVKPTSYTFSGFTGPWGSRILDVYNNANQLNEHWGKMDTNQDGTITQDEFSAYLGLLGLTADGKLGRKTLAAMGLAGQLNNYSWMNPVNPVVQSKPASDEAYEMPENHLLSKNTRINNDTDFVPEWSSPKFKELITSEKILDAKNKFGDGNFIFIKDSNGLYVAVRKPQQQEVLNSTFANAMLQTAYAENPAVMTATGWRRTNDGNYVQDLLDDPAVTELRNNLAVIGATATAPMLAGAASSFMAPAVTQQAIPWLSKPAGYLASPTGTILRDATGKILMVYKQGGLLKFEQGGTANLQEQALLDATLGMIGYAKSRGTELDFESALTLVIEVSLSQPEALLLIILNEGFINAGAKSLLTKDPNLFKLLQQPGTLNKIISLLSLKASVKQQKTKTAMKGTKLDYIKELKGICPEGYEMQYFAKGGHLCPVCKPKKIEEAKCGKKMKKHEDGNKVTSNNNGTVSSQVLKVKQDIQDSLDKNDNKKWRGSVPTTPRTGTARTKLNESNKRLIPPHPITRRANIETKSKK